MINDELFGEWEEIRKASDDYLASEPAIPIPFLEVYMRSYYYYCRKVKKPDARMYEIAKQVFDLSADSKLAIPIAHNIMNDPENLRIYQKEILPIADRQKISALEKIEDHVLEEFGATVRIRNTIQKAASFLFKESREQRAREKEIQTEWVNRIRRIGRSSTPYVHGYTEFLCSFVYMGTDDVKKAIRSLEDAYRSGFDRGLVAGWLSNIHDALKDEDEAAKYAQLALDHLGVESMEEAKKLEQEEPITIIKRAGRDPQFATRLWKNISQENILKQEKVVEDLEPKLEAARKDNIEKRTKVTIQLLDSLIPATSIDEILSEGKNLNEVTIDTRSGELLLHSPEEIDLFRNAGLEMLFSFYGNQTTVQNAIDYLDNLMRLMYDNVEANLEDCIDSFPNLLSNVSIVKKYVSRFVQNDQQDSALKLVEHAIEKRASTKAATFYNAIRPLQESFQSKQQWLDEIDLLTRVRKILDEREFKEATKDLTEAYVVAINTEKSLNKKARLLKEAESEDLDDDRLMKMRDEVNALLSRRKRILTQIALGIGALAVIAVIIAILFN